VKTFRTEKTSMSFCPFASPPPPLGVSVKVPTLVVGYSVLTDESAVLAATRSVGNSTIQFYTTVGMYHAQHNVPIIVSLPSTL
jgi:hypothetical protein